ncbi:MAG: hypothetical protein PHR66_13150 [Desulfuromonadaceae bacterium]|nr:hypothetical protein [Desulfuromonadaceae bacterium]
MPKAIMFLLVTIFCMSAPALASAAANRPIGVWNYYHFDGSAFIPGPAVDGNAFIALREKFQPVVLTVPTAHFEETALPHGAGVIAGICYLQISGGKLGGGGGFKTFPHMPLTVFSEGKQLVTVQTDDNGYFVVVLPAGTYSVGTGAFTVEIAVKRGTTTLVPLRAGKRMVD